MLAKELRMDLVYAEELSDQTEADDNAGRQKLRR
jgi:hypothetical protein